MSSPLSAVPVDQRRRLAATLGSFATLLVVIGVLTATRASGVLQTVLAVVALAAGVVLALLAWGVVTSVRQSADERRVDAAVEQALAAVPPAARRQLQCGCGHEHDPDELHVVDAEPAEPAGVATSGDACAHDGTGVACTHSCDTCALSALRAERLH